MGYTGSRHFDAHAYRTEDFEGVKDFARGCMHTYLVLKEKAAQWNADKEIQALRAEINIRNPKLEEMYANFSPEAVTVLKAMKFDRPKLGARGLPYEKLDQLTIEILMGVR